MSARILLGVIGLCSGVAVAVAVTSFAAAVGVYPRLTARSHGAKHMLALETVVQVGIFAGALLTLFDIKLPWSYFLLPLWGFFMGNYVGCLIMALAEVLEAFPIMFRRLHIKEGLPWLITAVALGKACGSMYYFAMMMWKS
ncbi:MAG: stage V sporulation protein AB [Lachnospiraceae bacterium]